MGSQTVLPRWRGFNVHNMFHTSGYEPFREQDFLWISDWGFDFARIPVCYALVVRDRDPYKPNEQALEEVDRGIELACKHGLHACLDMHVAPGYAYHQSE
jgi:endoglucanase